jgi:hypothetical protein
MNTETHVLKVDGKTFICRIIEHTDCIEFNTNYPSCGPLPRVVLDWHAALENRYQDDLRPHVLPFDNAIIDTIFDEDGPPRLTSE